MFAPWRVVRQLARQPFATVMAIVALAVGVGLSTTMFSILRGVVLRGLPFARSEQLFHVAPFDRRDNGDMFTTPWELVEWRRRQQSFEDLMAFVVADASVVGQDGTPTQVRAAWVTANTLQVLRTRPALGRGFSDTASEPGAPVEVLLSDRVWRDRFAGRADALGASLRINGTVATVTGVMAPGFAFPMAQDLWVALTVDRASDRAAPPTLEVVGRLRDGVAPRQAVAEIATIQATLWADDPARRDVITAEITPFIAKMIGRGTVRLLQVMMAAVLLVLLIACGNVANLVLARIVDRTTELAVHVAIGASRAQVVWHVLAEVVVWAGLGGVAGLGAAYLGTTLFTRAIADTHPPFWVDVRIDWPVLGFVVGAVAVAVVVAGLLPALHAARTDVARLLGGEGRGTTSLRVSRFSRYLVIGELAMSFALLVVSLLAVQSIVNATRFDPGIASADIFTARMSVPSDADDEGRRRFPERLVELVSAVPGVRQAALGSAMPPGGRLALVSLPADASGAERPPVRVQMVAVTDGYFPALDFRPARGRAITRDDHDAAVPVAVVSETFARLYLRDGGLGQRLRLAEGGDQQWRTVVGVVPDLADLNGLQRTLAAVYVPLAQAPAASLVLLARMSGDPLSQTAAIRRAVATLNPDLPVVTPTTLARALDEAAWPYRVFGSLFSVFGVGAASLATVGLYGVTAFAVSRRTREIGVRIALGATRGDVLGMVLRQGGRQVLTGVGVGLVAAVLLARALTLLFFEVSPYSPWAYGLVALMLVGTGLVATLVPAWRAASVDPTVALRDS